MVTKTRRRAKRTRKYQGREFKANIQAPTEDQLDEMIEGLQVYAAEHGLEPITILRKRPDPDGGWEATLSAHNFNIGRAIEWIKEKYRRFGVPEERLMPRSKTRWMEEEEKEGREEEERERRRKLEEEAAAAKSLEFEAEKLEGPERRMTVIMAKRGWEEGKSAKEVEEWRKARKVVREEEGKERKKRYEIEREQATEKARAARDEARARAGLPITVGEKILAIFSPGGREEIEYDRHGRPIRRRREGIARRAVRGGVRGIAGGVEAVGRATAPSGGRKLRAPAPRVAPRVSTELYRTAPRTFPSLSLGLFPSISPSMLLPAGPKVKRKRR